MNQTDYTLSTRPAAVEENYKPQSLPSGTRVAFIEAGWHADIVQQARQAFIEEMARHQVGAEDIDVVQVPGAFEIPLHARKLAQSGHYAAIVGCALVVDGGIYRHEFVAQTVVGALFEHILPLVPGLTLALHNGIDVLDIGCGRGKALLAMAERFPNSRFTGWDLSGEAVQFASDQAAARGLANVRFETRNLTDFHQTAPAAAFDLITAFDAIHDQARPDHVLAGIRRALKSDGLFLMQDIGASSNVAENTGHLIGTLLYSLSCTHCMTVSLAQGGLGVGAMWGEELTREFFMNAGFQQIERHTLPHDIQNFYYLVKP